MKVRSNIIVPIRIRVHARRFSDARMCPRMIWAQGLSGLVVRLAKIIRFPISLANGAEWHVLFVAERAPIMRR